jgi:hypothetical protein
VWRKITVMLTLLTCTVLVMAVLCVLVFPWFHKVAAGMFTLTGMVAAVRHRRWLPCIAETSLAIAGGIVIFVSLVIFVPREGHRQYTSPQGTRTVILEFDHASRPLLYQRWYFFMWPVTLSEFRGSMEIIPYTVRWLSEDELLLRESTHGNAVTVRLGK